MISIYESSSDHQGLRLVLSALANLADSKDRFAQSLKLGLRLIRLRSTHNHQIGRAHV